MIFGFLFFLFRDLFLQVVLVTSIKWFELDENGFLKDSSQSIPSQAAVYLYQSLLYNDKIYIGSAFNLLQRFNQHRARVKSSGYATSCPEPKFYHFIQSVNMGGTAFNLVS
jgi:predicted GIY-YIG superfamily endonuclease